MEAEAGKKQLRIASSSDFAYISLNKYRAILVSPHYRKIPAKAAVKGTACLA
jgi:hypothetical protein